MSSRTSRVEQLLRREIAEMLLRGELRDPVLRDPSSISITGASVSSDLSVARVFVDVLGGRSANEVLRVLNAAAGKFRSHIGRVARLRRVPSIRFESDPSIAHGAAIERVLAELAAEPRSTQTAQEHARQSATAHEGASRKDDLATTENDDRTSATAEKRSSAQESGERSTPDTKPRPAAEDE